VQGVEGKTGNRRIGFSYILFIISIVGYVVALGYSALASDWKAKAAMPQIDPILAIIKDLRQYQTINASFPQSFDQMEATRSKPSKYGTATRSLVVKNYYYLYTFIEPDRCTLWAIPIGPRASEASSYFLILTPTDREKFKGPPLDLKEVGAITGTPTYAQLGLLGMIKQESVPGTKR
jgi:hypothetical protein